jgi:hypothetical protein
MTGCGALPEIANARCVRAIEAGERPSLNFEQMIRLARVLGDEWPQKRINALASRSEPFFPEAGAGEMPARAGIGGQGSTPLKLVQRSVVQPRPLNPRPLRAAR